MKKTLTLLLLLAFYQGHSQLLTPTGSMNVGRFFMTTQMLSNGKVLACCGTDDNIPSAITYNSAEVYDPASGTWSLTGSLHRTRSGPASALLPNGMVLVIGGDYDANNPFVGSESCELYNPTSGTWSFTDSMKYNRSYPAAIVLNSGKVLVEAGGGDSTEIYDPSTGKWSTAGATNLTWGTYCNLVKLADGRVIITGAESDQLEIYDPTTAIWTIVPATLSCQRDQDKAILMSNGNVLFSGGGPYYDSTTCEMFNPNTNTVSPAVGYANAFQDCNMINLSNGNVLVSSPGNILSNNLGSLQVYDPTNNTTFLAGFVNAATTVGTDGYGIYLLSNDKILIAGGYYGFSAFTECYLVDENSISPNSVDVVSSSGDVNVSPNPGNGLFEISDSKFQAGQLEVYNVLGELVLAANITQQHTRFDITSQPAGVYFYQLHKEDGTNQTGKLVIQ